MPHDFSTPFKERVNHISERFVLREFVRFLLSGGFATAVHWCVMALILFTSGILVGESAADDMALLATCIGATVGAIINYLLQYHFTFTCAASHRVAGAKYLLAAGISWCLNAAFFQLLISQLIISILAAQLMTTILVMLINYVGYRYFVFRA